MAQMLRLDGFSVALTDLDTVAEMALLSLPNWDWAHEIGLLVHWFRCLHCGMDLAQPDVS
jgi:hypothetical protein